MRSATPPSTPEWVSLQVLTQSDVLSHANTLDSIGAQALVESNVFVDIKSALTSQFSKEDGYAVANDNDFGSSENSAPAGELDSVPYEYTLLGSEKVKGAVVGTAGNTLTLG